MTNYIDLLGYEEAGAQGIIAGANAAAKILGKPPLSIDRSEGYLGVLVDDLIRVGVAEPYRMFTSRAEFRILLRPDNADIRLTHKGEKLGLVSTERAERTRKIKKHLSENLAELKSVVLSSNEWQSRFNALGVSILSSSRGKKSALDVLGMESIEMAELAKCIKKEVRGDVLENQELWNRLKIEASYARALESEQDQIEMMKAETALKFPKGFDFTSPRPDLALTKEEQEHLSEACPENIGDLARIPGVTPATTIRLIYFLKKRQQSPTPTVGNFPEATS